ncbi:MAG TPA: alpha/beta hydrolase [Eggerthellaceae bacterium]|nr:alpha/beta hydrolase [Eggerthellaceae bacterium]
MILDEESFDAGNGTVAYWVDASAGPDAPWLVFLPGLTADHTLFDAQMAHFSGKANCLVWDAPAHGESRPYPLGFTMDDLARVLHGVLESEAIERPVLVGQSLGGYISQAFIDLYPGETGGFVSIDSAPLQKRYMKGWEIWTIRHTRLMYLSIPWKLLVKWVCENVAETRAGQDNMRTVMESYGKRGYCELAAHGYRMTGDAINANRAYLIDCPALLLCGEHDGTGFIMRYNKEWAKAEGYPLVWVPNARHNSPVDNPDFVNERIEGFALSLEI